MVFFPKLVPAVVRIEVAILFNPTAVSVLIKIPTVTPLQYAETLVLFTCTFVVRFRKRRCLETTERSLTKKKSSLCLNLFFYETCSIKFCSLFLCKGKQGLTRIAALPQIHLAFLTQIGWNFCHATVFANQVQVKNCTGNSSL